MTPEQAISILDQATAQAPLQRQAHQQVLEALRILNDRIQAKPESKKEAVKPEE